MNFDDFINSLSDEQKQKLMQGLMEAAKKPPVKIKARDLPSRKSREYVVNYATDVFGDISKAQKWLVTNIQALDGKCPLDLLNTDDGLQIVIDILDKIQFGTFS